MKFQRDKEGRSIQIGSSKRLNKLNRNHRVRTNCNGVKGLVRSNRRPEGAMFLRVQKPEAGLAGESGVGLSGHAAVFSLLHVLGVCICFLTLSFLLHSLTPEIVSTPSSPEEEEKSILSAVVLIDDSVPTTKIQIRLADGSRLIQKFNSTHR